MQPPLLISERCSFDKSTNYTVLLYQSNSTGQFLEQQEVVISTNGCISGTCSAAFHPNLSNLTYGVNVSVVNIFGESETTVLNIGTHREKHLAKWVWKKICNLTLCAM